MSDLINAPAHYISGGLEAWDVARAFDLDQCGYLFNVWKYLARAGRKDGNTELQDLRKARAYLNRKIALLEEVDRG